MRQVYAYLNAMPYSPPYMGNYQARPAGQEELDLIQE